MSIRQLKSGRWVLDYYPQGRTGKRIRKVLRNMTEQQARDFDQAIREHSLKARKGAGPDPDLAHPHATVRELMPAYLQWYALHRAPTSLADLSLIVEKHWSRYLSDYAVAQIGPEHYTLYQQMRSRENVSNRTINKELAYFGGFLSWCRRIKRLDCPKPVIDQLPYKRPIPIVLTPAEILNLLAHCKPQLRAFVLCLYTLGLRVNEARLIRWQDIDMDGNAVRVIQKGGTHKLLPLNNPLKKALGALPRKQERVFVGRQGKPLTNVRKALLVAAAKAGIEKHVHPHLFRHSWATHLLAAGVNMRIIQQFLGHSQIHTTQWYSQVDLGNMREAGKAVHGKLLGLQEDKEKETTP